MHTRVALVLVAVAVRVALFTADDVHPPADALRGAQPCPPLCRVLGWGAARTYAAYEQQHYDREGTCWPPSALVPARLLALAADALFAFAVNDFCFVAYAHTQLRRDIVFGILFNTPMLLTAGHLQLRPHCAVLAALVLLAMTNFWRGNIYRAWFLAVCAAALDAALAPLLPVFLVFFVRCVAASTAGRRTVATLWRPVLFVAVSVVAAIVDALVTCRSWLFSGSTLLALVHSLTATVRPAQVLAAVVYLLLQVMTLRALWKRCSPVMLTIAMVQTSLFWCVCFAFWWSPELHLLIACMCTCAMCGINRHAGRLSVLTSLFCSTVMLSRFSWTDNAQWPYLPFLFFYVCAHWMLHMASHVAMNVTTPRQSAAFFPRRSWHELVRRQLRNTTQNVEIVYFSAFAVLPHTLNLLSGLISQSFAKWSYCFFQLLGFLYILLHLFTRLLPSFLS